MRKINKIDVVEKKIYEFFVNSKGFNGIPISDVFKEIDMKNEDIIDIIKNLVSKELVVIQKGGNSY